MNRSIIKLTKREIRSSLGRYLAIFAIIALGAGLFVGRACRARIFSKRIIITLIRRIFMISDLSQRSDLPTKIFPKIKKLDGVKLAEGAVGADFLFNTADEDNLIMMAPEHTRKCEPN